MEVSINKSDLDSLEDYIKNCFIKDMNANCVPFEAMAFAVQTLLDAINDVEKEMEEE